MKQHWIRLNPLEGTITLTLDPEMAQSITQHLPRHDPFNTELASALARLESMMQTRQLCPGSGTEGQVNGALLICPYCKRLIGVAPPNTLPNHELPVFDDGVPII